MTKVKFDDTEIEYDDEYVPGRDEFDYNDFYSLDDTQTIDVDLVNNEINNGDDNE